MRRLSRHRKESAMKQTRWSDGDKTGTEKTDGLEPHFLITKENKSCGSGSPFRSKKLEVSTSKLPTIRELSHVAARIRRPSRELSTGQPAIRQLTQSSGYL